MYAEGDKQHTLTKDIEEVKVRSQLLRVLATLRTSNPFLVTYHNPRDEWKRKQPRLWKVLFQGHLTIAFYMVTDLRGGNERPVSKPRPEK